MISKMQIRFELLKPKFSPEKLPNFIDDAVDLIYYSDQKK